MMMMVKAYVLTVLLQFGYAGMFVISVASIKDLTSAGFASALYNMIPAITFIMAIIIRIEKLRINSRHSQAKIVGSLVTAAGALLMLLYRGPVVEFVWSKLGQLQGVVCSGVAYYVQGTVMKERGPVFVTAFNPLFMIITAILGSIILAEEMTLGSVIGAVIIVVGLYALIWGKSKDQAKQSWERTAPKGTLQLPIAATDAGKFGSSGQVTLLEIHAP
ncbi:hypothetical protein GW17_00004423 [Ensete ventricosum]|nr:hypothetical protein GW17_00004423 [Ensete ventricosum]